MSIYYDFRKLDSYGCPLRVVVSDRGKGKTFGARRKVIEKGIDRGTRFIWIVENTVMQQRLQSSNGELFFQNIKRYYREHNTKTNQRYLSKLEKVDVDEDVVVRKSNVVVRGGAIRIDGKVVGYIVALSEFAKAKGNDFGDINYIIADEFIPEIINKTTRDNVRKLISIIQSACRTKHVIVYMFANATNITDEMAIRLGIHKQKIGTYRKLKDDIGLLGIVHYVDPNEYKTLNEIQDKSVAGRIAKFFEADNLDRNEFKTFDIELIPHKRGQYKRMWLIKLEGKIYEFSRAYDHGCFYFQEIKGTKSKHIFNNFIFGEVSIKNYIKNYVTVGLVKFDCYLSAQILYEKLGLSI